MKLGQLFSSSSSLLQSLSSFYWFCLGGYSKVCQSKAKWSEAKQSKARQNKAKQNKALDTKEVSPSSVHLPSQATCWWYMHISGKHVAVHTTGLPMCAGNRVWPLDKKGASSRGYSGLSLGVPSPCTSQSVTSNRAGMWGWEQGAGDMQDCQGAAVYPSVRFNKSSYIVVLLWALWPH